MVENALPFLDCTASHIGQLDGQGETKHMDGSNPNKAGTRMKLHAIWGRYGPKPKQESGDANNTDIEPDDNSPLKAISPKPTKVSILDPPPPRSISVRHWSHRRRRERKDSGKI
jgi:hypothetical protein